MPIDLTPDASHAPNTRGPASLFGDLRSAMPVTNAVPRAKRSVLDILPVTRGNLPESVRLPIMTGYNPGTTGANVVANCEPPSHVVGEMMITLEDVEFGKLSIRDLPNDLDAAPPLRYHEVNPVTYVGDPMDVANGTMIESAANQAYNNNGNPETQGWLKAITLLMGMEQAMLPTVWTADGTDTGDKSWQPPKGLDALVHDNHIHVVSSTPAPGANSYVADFASEIIGDAGVALKAYRALVRLERSMQHRAETFFPNSQVFFLRTMHPALFHSLASIWAFAMYDTGAFDNAATGGIRFNVSDPQQAYREMIGGSYLWIDGRQVQFFLDHTKPLTQVAGVGNEDKKTTAVHYHPFSVDGRPGTIFDWATYLTPHQYLDPFRMRELQRAGGSILQNGRWLTYRNPYTNGCGGEMHLKIRPRFLLPYPQLAGKLLNVGFEMDYEFKEWNDTAGGGDALSTA